MITVWVNQEKKVIEKEFYTVKEFKLETGIPFVDAMFQKVNGVFSDELLNHYGIALDGGEEFFTTPPDGTDA